jgi:hypothetical protein
VTCLRKFSFLLFWTPAGYHLFPIQQAVKNFFSQLREQHAVMV